MLRDDNRAAGGALYARIAEGVTAVGVSCRLGCPAIAEMSAVAGVDYVYLDQQHGFVSSGALVEMITAMARTETTIIVRVPANDPALIGFALDVGAHGVLVPVVESAADAERAVAACRYGPDGVRSWGVLRGHRAGVDPATTNREVLCFPLVEDRNGVAAVDEISRVDGVSGIWIGPADLALSMGLSPGEGLLTGPLAEAVDRVVAACASAGIPAAISGNPADMSARGFGMVTAGSDHGFVKAGIARAVEARNSLTEIRARATGTHG